jgi:hypothetical protein
MSFAKQWCVSYITPIYSQTERYFQLPFNSFTTLVERHEFRSLVTAAYDVLVDIQLCGLALPEGFKKVEELYLWIDDYMGKLNKDLERMSFSFFVFQSTFHCLITESNPELIIMTAEDRDFNRYARIVAHCLEIFRHLQEMRFEDPRMVLEGLHELIDHMVSLYPLLLIFIVIANHYFRLLSSRHLDSIQSTTFSFKRFTETSPSFFSKILSPRCPTAGIS